MSKDNKYMIKMIFLFDRKIKLSYENDSIVKIIK